MPRIRETISSLMLAALFTSMASAARAEDAKPPNAARDVVGEALVDVMAALNDENATDANRRDRIAAIAFSRFDFSTMSKLVIARPWRKFSPGQKDEFIEEFKQHLANSYGRRLSRYAGLQVKVVSHVVESRGDVTVYTEIVGGQFDGAAMNYRMRGKTGEWLVIDVIIEGVSLVSNFRSQFKPILASGGADELLRRLKDKNDVLAARISIEESGEAAEPVAERVSSD